LARTADENGYSPRRLIKSSTTQYAAWRALVHDFVGRFTMKLWLVCHAQPLIEAGICYGRLNVPATTTCCGSPTPA